MRLQRTTPCPHVALQPPSPSSQMTPSRPCTSCRCVVRVCLRVEVCCSFVHTVLSQVHTVCGKCVIKGHGSSQFARAVRESGCRGPMVACRITHESGGWQRKETVLLENTSPTCDSQTQTPLPAHGIRSSSPATSTRAYAEASFVDSAASTSATTAAAAAFVACSR